MKLALALRARREREKRPCMLSDGVFWMMC